jgi:transcriptional regulator with XRE-family HTH domain
MDNGYDLSETATESLQELLSDDASALEQYLKQSFLMEAMLSLFQARRQANLTQQQVATRMGTKQSVVARWEADFSGAMSLRNYVEFAFACGVRPFDLTLAPLSAFVPFAKQHPDRAITVEAYQTWLRATDESVTAVGNTLAVASTPTIFQSEQQDTLSSLKRTSTNGAYYSSSVLNQAAPSLAPTAA